MLRSIIAVTFGVLLAVAFVIYVSFFVSAAILGDTAPVEDMNSMPFSIKLGVIAVWFAGTFLGAAAASVGARKWAPAAWVVTSTMALFAVANFSSVPGPIWLLVISLCAIGAAGWSAIKLTRANYGLPQTPQKGGLGL